MKSLRCLPFVLLFWAGVAVAEYPAVRNDSATTTVIGVNGSPGPMSVDSTGRLFINPGVSGSALGKTEDAVAASGDIGVMCLGVGNTNLGSTLAASGDYIPFATNTAGAVYVIPAATTDGASAAKLEDVASAASDGLMSVGGIREDALTTNTGTTGDYTPFKADGNGRQIITYAPPGESWQGCGTATASTSDVAIKAAVASNRIYVTAITCASSDADNATNINFKDGATVIAVGGVNQMATTSAGTFTARFMPPLRGTVNTAFNFNTAISTSSVICCGSGYISVL